MTKLFLLAALLTSSSAFASMSVSPWSIDFFTQDVGSRSFPEQLTIRNDGPNDIRSLRISSNCYGDFDVQAYFCYGPLRPYQSCRLDVTFAPLRDGYQSCTMRVMSDDGSMETVWVTGTGVMRRPLTSQAPTGDLTKHATQQDLQNEIEISLLSNH